MTEGKPLWKSPTGVSAGAALLTALSAIVAVLFQVGVPSGQVPSGDGPESTSPAASGPPASPSPQAGFKMVFHPSGSLSMEVPADWETGPSTTPDLRDGKPAGPAITATTDVARYPSWKIPWVVLGASRSLATEFGLADRASGTRLDRMTAYIRAADWTKDGCVFDGESSYQRGQYTGVNRRWRNCGQVGAFFWELAATTTSGKAMVYLQITFQQLAESSIADRILAGFEVTEERLPAK